MRRGWCAYCDKDHVEIYDEDICTVCADDPEIKQQYDEDVALDAAEAAHDEDHRREARNHD